MTKIAPKFLHMSQLTQKAVNVPAGFEHRKCTVKWHDNNCVSTKFTNLVEVKKVALGTVSNTKPLLVSIFRCSMVVHAMNFLYGWTQKKIRNFISCPSLPALETWHLYAIVIIILFLFI